MTQKTFFIIPGFKEQATDKNYAWLFDFLKTKNYEVVSVPIDWNYKTLSDNAVELVDFLKKYQGGDNYVLGFSYGAVLAILTSNEIRPKKLYLCSLSPDFSEDLKDMSPDIKKYIGKRRCLDIRSRSGRKIAKELTKPTIIFYGEKEGEIYPALKNRCTETAKLASNAKLVVVKEAPHKINFPGYMNAIKGEIE